MTSAAHAIRRGTLEAARVHRALGIGAEAMSAAGRIDVMKIAALHGLEILFRPLDGLLGAYYRGPSPGALVTTNRPLTVQRFTAAHELGHHVLGHEPSLDDDDILRRVPFVASTGDNVQEVEADAFAAALLLPRWLVTLHCQRQGWTDGDLQSPEMVYQLALRAGTSYEATCWILCRYKIIDLSTARKLAVIKPKEIKKTLLGAFSPDDFHGDVWLLTDRDAGATIEGSGRDIFVFSLPENSGGGYVWGIDGLTATFPIVSDERSNDAVDDDCGGPVHRRITVESRTRQAGEVRLTERRPWVPAKPLHTFALAYDLTGAESGGLSRAERRLRLEDAA